jgi:hypothetical protein
MGERAWIAVAGALALVVFLPLAAPDLGFRLPTGQPFSTADAPVVQIVGPVMGTPRGAGWLGSTLLSRLALLPPIGAPAARIGGLAIIAGLLSVLFTFRLYRRLALSAPSALIGALVAATGGTVLSLVGTGSQDAVLAALVPGLFLCGLWWVDTGRPAALGVLGVATFLGVGSYPVLLVVVCGVVAVTAGTSAGNRLRPLAVTIGAAALGLLHRTVATLLAVRAAADALPPSSGLEPLMTWSSSMVVGGPRLDAVGDRLALVGAVFTDELGLLGSVLALIGLATLTGRSRARGLAWSWAAVLLWLVAWLSATPEGGPRVAAILSWLLAGAGIDWIWRSSAKVGARAGAVTIGLVLVGAGVAGHRAETPWSTRVGGATYVDRLRESLPAGAGVVSERPVLDRALSTAGGVEAPLTRLPRQPSLLRRLHEAGQPIVAFSGARDELERVGLQFEATAVPDDWVAVTRLLHALPRGAIVAAAGGPGLNRAVTPETAALFSDVGGAAELFGQGRTFYGVVGVAHRDGLAAERQSADGVVLEVGIGDQVGSFPVRATSALRVASDTGGASVEVNGRVVARTATGLALAAVAPDGRVLTAVGVELDRGLDVPLVVVEPMVSRMVGWEPCRPLPAGEWIEVGVAAASGALGSQLPSTKDTLVVYLTARSDREVELRPADAAAGLSRARYHVTDADQRAELGRRLEADQAPFGATLMTASIVRRLELTRAGPVAIGLGEAPTTAYARYLPGEPAVDRVELCGAVSGAPRFDRGASSETIAVADLQTGGWGWHDSERDARGPFRWSDGPETGLLLQLIRVGATRVEVDASAAAVDLRDDDESVTLTLLVNGTPLPSMTMGRDVQTYAWQVPAEVWKTGMNRVGLRVSAAVSPSSLGISTDQRILGLALRRLELTLLE